MTRFAPLFWAGLSATLAMGCATKITETTTGSGGSGGSVSTGGQGGTGGSGGDMNGMCKTASDCTLWSSACTEGECVNGACMGLPVNQFGACDDGSFCTETDTCQDGVCVGGTAKSCNSGDPCKVGMCNEETDSCDVVPGNNGAQCDDGDPCTYAGKCQNGACQKGMAIDCSFLSDQCNTGICDPGTGCMQVPGNNGGACEDGQFCTEGTTCLDGACQGGGPTPCAPPGGCFVGVCDELNDTCSSMPGNDGAACDDNSPCTAGTTCSAGKCINGTPANDGMACDDGASCTMGEFCTGGTCGGGMGPMVFFSEDFSDNAAGWILGPEWEIGPAMASMGGVGNPDPSKDHTATDDNGIAGVVIGGDATPMIHPYYWLESPFFDSSAAPGPVILGFYRWLNSDYHPFMHNKVEVWNGMQWINIWTSGSEFTTEASWNYYQYDVTNYKNASMRVRFGFDINSEGVFTIGSWNIDDILVASAACP